MADFSYETLIVMNLVFGLGFLCFLLVVVWLLYTREIKDHFILLAMDYLAVALFLRVTMSTLTTCQDSADFSALENIPLQQIYFEVPFYSFVVVMIAMLFSWYQLYRQVYNFVEGPTL